MLPINAILLIVTLCLVIPLTVFCLECLAAIMSQQVSTTIANSKRPKTAVLIPAYNEAAQIGLVIETVQKQLVANDLLVVIADNCEDNTAEIACLAGATVIERSNKIERGKGYALACGLQSLANNPPEVVIFLDADCIVSHQAIAHLSYLAKSTGRPVQAQYLMEQANKPQLKDRISAFALQIKNRIRFLGLRTLNAHCLLTGSGMAFSWSVINQVSLAGAVNADDMKLTVDLALMGKVPLYCEEALVIGRLMENQDAQSQRTRWEHGHLQMILVEVPRLLKAFVVQKRWSLLVLALDVGIPPMSLLVILWVAITVIAIIATFLGASSLPALILGGAGIGLILVLLLTWNRFGKADLPLKDLMAIPGYILSKTSIYLQFLIKPQSSWLKTERDLPLDK